MRPRGQTPWMPARSSRRRARQGCFNEATGADPVDAGADSRSPHGSDTCFNEATGADPVDAPSARTVKFGRRSFNEATGADPVDADKRGVVKDLSQDRFNEATGADPVDAHRGLAGAAPRPQASMRPRGQTPWMPDGPSSMAQVLDAASMRPRGQTPWMPESHRRSSSESERLQ